MVGKRRGRPVVLTDPRAIRALAHPARLTVMDRLYAGETATATELAQHAGLSPSALSYHLRALEKWGIVERVEPTTDGRERPWKAAGSALQISSTRPRATAAAEIALVGTMLDAERRAVEDFLGRQADEPVEWREAVTIHSGRIVVTVEELAAVAEAVRGVLHEHESGARRRQPADARTVRFSVVLVPAD